MATQPPYSGISTSSNSVPPAGTSQRMALDNILRRELRVSDPNDPSQVAQALLTRYKDTPRAQAISQEAKGLPFLQSSSFSSVLPQASTSSDVELQQARDDVERDLQELTTNSSLKDVIPELQGWAQAVRSATQEGTTAARFALDPRQRDKAFATRRQLGDYARIARFVGALTPSLNIKYRNFAQSLDEVSAVILVTMGESLANVGFNGGRFLLQAPFSELQARRDAAIYALRNLIGATQEAYGPNEWPRGLDAYRVLFKKLEDQGQGDLRSLLVETELARSMDELIQRAAHGRAEGLRALGSTAQLDLERFRRLVIIGDGSLDIESPPLTAFLEALQLFADAFDSSGGFRLIRVARPPITLYGLYGLGGLDAADERLLQLIIKRGLLADRLDCFLQCECAFDEVKCQVMLDKILYDVDRAIDLYATGKADFGPPERRSAAYSLLIDSFFKLSNGQNNLFSCNENLKNNLVQPLLKDIKELLAGPKRIASGVELNVRTYGSLVELALVNIPDLKNDLNAALGTVATLANGSFFNVLDLAIVLSLAQRGEALLAASSPPVILTTIPAQIRVSVDAFVAAFDLDGVLTALRQELCIQRDAQSRWKDLVKSMAPDCLDIDKIFLDIDSVISGALDKVGDTSCPSFGPSIPPHYETSLEALVKSPRR